MSGFNIIPLFFRVVFILGILYTLAVRWAKHLVRIELQSSAPNPFADILLSAESTPELSASDIPSPSEDKSIYLHDYAPHRKRQLNPTLMVTRHEHAPSS